MYTEGQRESILRGKTYIFFLSYLVKIKSASIVKSGKTEIKA